MNHFYFKKLPLQNAKYTWKMTIGILCLLAFSWCLVMFVARVTHDFPRAWNAEGEGQLVQVFCTKKGCFVITSENESEIFMMSSVTSSYFLQRIKVGDSFRKRPHTLVYYINEQKYNVFFHSLLYDIRIVSIGMIPALIVLGIIRILYPLYRRCVQYLKTIRN